MASPPGSQDDHPPLGAGGATFGFLNDFDDGPRYQVCIGCLYVWMLVGGGCKWG